MTREIPLGSMADVAAQVAADSPLIREALESMLMELIQDMRNVIRSGHRANITPLQRAILPGLLRGLQNGQNAQQELVEREAYDRMRAGMNGGLVLDVTADVTN